MIASAAAARLPAIGDLVRHRRLGSVSTYRVCDRGGDLVELEVIRVAGLRMGQRFRFTRGAVGNMERGELHGQDPTPTLA